MLRPDDWTDDLMQRILHECRVFAHPTFNLATQKELIMTFFDQVTESITKKFLTIFCPGVETNCHAWSLPEAPDGPPGDAGLGEGAPL